MGRVITIIALAFTMTACASSEFNYKDLTKDTPGVVYQKISYQKDITMYKSIVIAGALVASIATASAQNQIVQDANGQHALITPTGTELCASQVDCLHRDGRIVTTESYSFDIPALYGETEANRQQTATNRGAINSLGRVVEQHDDAIGGIGQLAQRIDTLESRTVTNGADGADGADGRDGVDGQDGRDANTTTVYQGIAGASALSFANSGGAGLGIGIAGYEGQNAGAISYTHEFNNRFSASFGATSSGSAGGGFKFKF